jgi:formate hydrogenlyase transcriptional activator
MANLSCGLPTQPNRATSATKSKGGRGDLHLINSKDGRLSLPTNVIPAGLLRDLREAFAADVVSLLLLSQDGRRFDLCRSEGKTSGAICLPANEGVAAQIAAARQPIIIEDKSTIRAYSPVLGAQVQSVLGASLRLADRVVGVLLLGTTQLRDFSQADLMLAGLAADQIAATLEHLSACQRYELSQNQLAEERARLRMLLDVNNSLVSKRDIQELFSAISESLRKLTHHHYSQIVLFDRKSNRLKVAAIDFPNGKGLIHEGLTVPCHGSPAGGVYIQRKPLLITRLDRDEFPSDTTDRLLEEGVRSICLAPLVRQQQVLGVISIGRAEGDAFTSDDLTLLTQVADQIAIAIENALAFEEIEDLSRRLAKEKEFLEEELRAEGIFNEVIGSSQALTAVLKQVQTVAPTYATVLIVGETGTGKELIARAVHQLGNRRDGPFVKLNCAAIPATLLESELFGHAKGAFTGADHSQLGRLELAEGGTIFLDEIGELPLELQPKLLRVLQDRQFERLGDTKTLTINVRLVAATNRNLAQMVKEGQFRSDLYYRLNVFPISVPPLREHKEDIPALVHYFADKFARQLSKRLDPPQTGAIDALMRCPWPGNVRELENFIERAVILSRGPVLELPVRELSNILEPASEQAETLADAEREHILRALRESNGLIGTPMGAAARLGLKRTTLYAKMKKLGISTRGSGSAGGNTP